MWASWRTQRGYQCEAGEEVGKFKADIGGPKNIEWLESSDH